MTDSKKLDLLLEKVINLDQNFISLDQKVSGLDQKFISLDRKVSGLEQDMSDVKADLSLLHRNAEFILDEVERVHSILDKHRENRSIHMA